MFFDLRFAGLRAGCTSVVSGGCACVPWLCRWIWCGWWMCGCWWDWVDGWSVWKGELHTFQCMKGVWWFKDNWFRCLKQNEVQFYLIKFSVGFPCKWRIAYPETCLWTNKDGADWVMIAFNASCMYVYIACQAGVGRAGKIDQEPVFKLLV